MQGQLGSSEKGQAPFPIGGKAPESQSLRFRGGATLIDLVRKGTVSIPRKHRAQKSFFRFLRRAGNDFAFMEQVNRLRDAVIVSSMKDMHSSGGVTIGLTGPRGREGTSLISLILGLALGECSQRRVALLDGGLNAQRFEVLSNVLGLSRNSVSIQKGFNEVSGYYNERSPNLFFLRNRIPERSVEFFSDKRLGMFLADLREQFDYTILDLPPLLTDTASVFVLPHIDRLFLLVEAGRTRLADVSKCVAMARQGEGALSGIIINKQRTPWWSRYFLRDFYYC